MSNDKENLFVSGRSYNGAVAKFLALRDIKGLKQKKINGYRYRL